MNKILLLSPFLFLSACNLIEPPLTRQEILANYRNQCLDYGFAWGSPQLAQCIQNLEYHEEKLNVERRKARALEDKTQASRWEQSKTIKHNGKPVIQVNETKTQQTLHSEKITIINNTQHHVIPVLKPTPPLSTPQNIQSKPTPQKMTIPPIIERPSEKLSDTEPQMPQPIVIEPEISNLPEVPVINPVEEPENFPQTTTVTEVPTPIVQESENTVQTPTISEEQAPLLQEPEILSQPTPLIEEPTDSNPKEEKAENSKVSQKSSKKKVNSTEPDEEEIEEATDPNPQLEQIENPIEN